MPFTTELGESITIREDPRNAMVPFPSHSQSALPVVLLHARRKDLLSSAPSVRKARIRIPKSVAETKSKLNLPGYVILLQANSGKVRRRDVCLWTGKHDIVKCVEQLGPEIQGIPLL